MSMAHLLAPSRGWPITLIRRLVNATSHHQGLVTTVFERALVVDAPGFGAWATGERAVAAAGEQGQRLLAKTEIAAVRANRVVVLLHGPWRPVDLRTSERFSVALQAEVFARGKRTGLVGRTIDISRGGMALSVADPIEGPEVVRLKWEQYQAHLPCEVVRTKEVRGLPVLHLRFRELNGPQAAFVRALVTDLEEREFDRQLTG
jgi:hypothetical protein